MISPLFLFPVRSPYTINNLLITVEKTRKENQKLKLPNPKKDSLIHCFNSTK